MSKAAELLDLSCEAFFALLGQRGLSFVNASTEQEAVVRCTVPVQKQAIEAAIGGFLEVDEPTLRQRYSRNLGAGEACVLVGAGSLICLLGPPVALKLAQSAHPWATRASKPWYHKPQTNRNPEQ